MFQSEKYRKILIVIGISLLTTLVVLAILAGIIYANRARIEGYIHPTMTATSLAEAHDQAVIAAVQKANPAVVSIIISKEEPIVKEYYQNEQIPDPFGMFGGGGGFSIQVPQYQQDGTQEQQIGGGSGFFVSSEGLIVTNDHVVSDNTASYTVYTNDGKEHPAKVIAQDAADDVAVVKIDGTGYPYLTFDNSEQLQLGQSVIAIGNALGQFSNTVSVGVVSGLSRSITAGDQATGGTENLSQVIQTDAAINPGNSGGPLLDLLGNVVGMNSAVAQGSQSIGFALPGNVVNQAVQSVIAHGKIEFPYMGLRYVAITDAIAQSKKLSVDYGDLVLPGPDASTEPAVVPGSPAAKAGIVSGDIVLEFNGMKLTSDTNLTDLVRAKNVGDTVTLIVLHNSKQETLTLTLAENVEQ
jgi:serine protease Do